MSDHHDRPEPTLARHGFTRRATQTARQYRALVDLVDAYQVYGAASTYRLLRDLGDHLGTSLAYIDRDTVEAHLERTLSEIEWAATNDQFTALDFDDHVGDHGSFRTDWIENLPKKAGGPGYAADADAKALAPPNPSQLRPDRRCRRMSTRLATLADRPGLLVSQPAPARAQRLPDTQVRTGHQDERQPQADNTVGSSLSPCLGAITVQVLS